MLSPRLLLATALPFSLLAACGDDAPIDPPEPDAETPAETREITLHAAGTALVAVRPDVEGAAWTRVTPGADGDAIVEVPDGPFRIASVCDIDGFFNYYTVLATPDDGPEFHVWCTQSTDVVDVSFSGEGNFDVRVSFHLSGPGGQVAIEPGTYDVVAIDRDAVPPRVQIQRDVAIDGDTEISFDLAAEGFDLVPATVTAGDGAVDYVNTRLMTSNGTRAPIRGVGDQAWLFPVAAQVDGDRQYVAVRAFDDSGSHGADRRVVGDETTVSVTYGEAITSASATWDGAPSVSWEGGGDFDESYLWVSDLDVTVLWDAFAMPGWVEATDDVTTLAIDAPESIPGWQAAWSRDSGAGLDWTVTLYSDEVAGQTQTAGWDGTFSDERRPAARLPRHDGRDARAPGRDLVLRRLRR